MKTVFPAELNGEFQENILEEDNKARKHEKAMINIRLKLIRFKQSQLEAENKKSQRLSDMKKKQEISLK